MLDLPPEFKCYILEIFFNEGKICAYYTLLEHPEIAELLRCNFKQQLKLTRRHRPLASQLHHILITTALLPARLSRSIRGFTEFLNDSLYNGHKKFSFRSATAAVSALVTYRDRFSDAETILRQFANMTRGNAMAWKFTYQEQPYCGFETLSEVGYHRILRAILRLQLYAQLRTTYGHSRKTRRKIRALSVAEWMILENKNVPAHYAKGIRSLFAKIVSYFEVDMAPYVKVPPAPSRDHNRRSKFSKHCKNRDDTPANCHEGSADEKTKDWKPAGYHASCFAEFTQKVYREFCLADGYPFWSRYTRPRDAWWHRRNDEHDLSVRCGESYTDPETRFRVIVSGA
ncbi:hypothetical protein CC86DRAFT_446547 [Ophiobolus disseminans]|uniref:Uncharacterized protein n=1 Tax=Ophiobolus disseminans TaxID=1469910 RepID=A0A6A6ZYC0_9PLEO|nr:hypothetical protein CC86DRAFT_446547 [Ophiobolus disseminans]